MASPLADRVAKVRRQRGEEAIHWRNGSTYRIVTPSPTGARGLSLDLAVIDEALAHEPELLRAIRPTMAQRDGAAGSIGAQLVIVSNAGDESARLLNEARELGRRAVLADDPSRCWFEWSASEVDDLYDIETWRRVIPTLDQPNGISSDFVRLEADGLDRAGFAREYLCLSLARPEDRLIDAMAWEGAPMVPMSGADAVFAVDASPDGEYGAIVVAGPVGDLVAVEVVEAAGGTAWLTNAVIERVTKWSAPVVVDAAGPLAWMLPALERANVEVISAGPRDVLAASSLFVHVVSANRLSHTRDWRLDKGVRAASRRRIGDRWCFNRQADGADVLVAASLAAWAVETNQSQMPMIYFGADPFEDAPCVGRRWWPWEGTWTDQPHLWAAAASTCQRCPARADCLATARRPPAPIRHVGRRAADRLHVPRPTRAGDDHGGPR